MWYFAFKNRLFCFSEEGSGWGGLLSQKVAMYDYCQGQLRIVRRDGDANRGCTAQDEPVRRVIGRELWNCCTPTVSYRTLIGREYGMS